MSERFLPPTRGLRTCEACGLQLDWVMEKMMAEAEAWEAKADAMDDMNMTWGRCVGEAKGIRWAAALIMENQHVRK